MEEDAGAAVDGNNSETKGHYLQNTNCCGEGPLYYYQQRAAAAGVRSWAMSDDEPWRWAVAGRWWSAPSS